MPIWARPSRPSAWQSNLSGNMKINDALSGAALVALGAVVLWHIQGFPPMPGQKYGPAWFPGLIAIGFIACGALLMTARLRAATSEALFALPEWSRRARPVAGVASVIAGLLLYIFAVDTLGFHLTAGALPPAPAPPPCASCALAPPGSVSAAGGVYLPVSKLLQGPFSLGLFLSL